VGAGSSDEVQHRLDQHLRGGQREVRGEDAGARTATCSRSARRGASSWRRRRGMTLVGRSGIPGGRPERGRRGVGRLFGQRQRLFRHRGGIGPIGARRGMAAPTLDSNGNATFEYVGGTSFSAPWVAGAARADQAGQPAVQHAADPSGHAGYGTSDVDDVSGVEFQTARPVRGAEHGEPRGAAGAESRRGRARISEMRAK